MEPISMLVLDLAEAARTGTPARRRRRPRPAVRGHRGVQRTGGELAVLTAAERAAVAGRPVVDQADFETAITRLRSARADLTDLADAEQREGRPATPAERAVIESSLQAQGVLEESA